MISRRKKGQAAMEFLMTYGWVILVFILAITALAYLGVLNQESLIPNSCTITDQFSCEEFKVSLPPQRVNIIIRNGRGVNVNNWDGTGGPTLKFTRIAGTTPTLHECKKTASAILNDGSTSQYTFAVSDCDSDFVNPGNQIVSGFGFGTSGSKFKTESLVLDYKESGTILPKNASGQLTTRVE